MDQTVELSDYKIEFYKHQMLGLWSYTITCPNGDILKPVMALGFGGRGGRKGAEVAALRQIDIHMQKETLNGQELFDRIDAAFPENPT